MTELPEWGAEITAILHRHLAEAYEKHGLRSALRVTPTDIRDQGRPPMLRSGEGWQRLKQSFESCIEAGADIASIESVGGKEVHDQGLLYGDVRSIVFALGVWLLATWRGSGTRFARSAAWSAEQFLVVILHVHSATRRCNWPTRRCCPKFWQPSSEP